MRSFRFLPFRSVRLHREKWIGNECFGFGRTPKIAFQKNLVLVTGFVREPLAFAKLRRQKALPPLGLRNQVFPRELEPCEGVWDQFPRRAGALQGPPTSPNLTSGSSGKPRPRGSKRLGRTRDPQAGLGHSESLVPLSLTVFHQQHISTHTLSLNS